MKGWHHHWFPYRLTVNTEDRRRGSGLFQQNGWTCGPLTVVKFIDTLFRLKLNHDVKFLGPRARQRIVEEKWNTLGTSRPFPDTITEHWEEAWNPEIDSETVVTDRDCIDYVTTTLLRSFLDGKAILELTAGTGDGFKVPPRPTQYNFKEMSDHMMVMTKQFSPFIDQYKRTVRNGSTPPRKKSPRKNLPRSNK